MKRIRRLSRRKISGCWYVQIEIWHVLKQEAVSRSRVYNQPMGYHLTACLPGDLSTEEVAVCVSIVQCGSAVDPESAAAEIPKAKVLAIARAGNNIVAVGAIKRQRPEYAANVARKSKFTFSADTLELGYIAVEHEHRGHHLSNTLVQTLLSNYPHDLFATTSNERMKRVLRRAGFTQQGQEWTGQRNLLSLWIRRQ